MSKVDFILCVTANQSFWTDAHPETPKASTNIVRCNLYIGECAHLLFALLTPASNQLA